MVYKIFEGDGPSPTPLDQGPTRSLGSLAREWTTTGLRPAKLSYKATTDPWPAAQNLNYHPEEKRDETNETCFATTRLRNVV